MRSIIWSIDPTLFTRNSRRLYVSPVVIPLEHRLAMKLGMSFASAPQAVTRNIVVGQMHVLRSNTSHDSRFLHSRIHLSDPPHSKRSAYVFQGNLELLEFLRDRNQLFENKFWFLFRTFNIERRVFPMELHDPT